MKKLILSVMCAATAVACCTQPAPKEGGKVPNEQKQWAWLGFERPEGANPVISPNTDIEFDCPMQGKPMKWMESDTFNPAAAIKDGEIIVMFRSEDNSATGIGQRTSRIGYASSKDGISFDILPSPVLYPNPNDSQGEAECPGGCEDPRVVMTEDGTYVMLYTMWNRKQARLGVATSRDLITWEKHGLAFGKAYDGRFANDFSKSASIVTKVVDGVQTVAQIDGKYYMYWGEQWVNVATSDNLIDWTPMLDEKGELLKVIEPREGYFDSMLTECGPPAVMTDDGILLMYNGKNMDGEKGDVNYTANSYCAGQVLFSKENPTEVIDRLDFPFFIPEADFEKSGQYPAGTVFIEGLVLHNGKWHLYYGCADSRVSVAIYDPAKM